MTTEVHLESINYRGHKIVIGHPVRVLPSKKGGKDGFDSLAKSFRGHVVGDKGVVTGIEVFDPKHAQTRFLGPERIVPYLRNVAAKTEALASRKVVPISSAKKAPAKKAAATSKVAK